MIQTDIQYVSTLTAARILRVPRSAVAAVAIANSIRARVMPGVALKYAREDCERVALASDQPIETARA